MNENDSNFARPILYEAVCEFHFEFAESERWNNAFAGKFLELIKSSHPGLEPSSDTPIEFQISNQGALTPSVLPSRQKFRYFSEQKDSCFILADNNIFGLSVLKNYQWEKFRDGFLDGWEKLNQCVKINRVKRIGLRYINHIPSLTGDESLNKWLKNEQYIPGDILKAKSNFVFNSEVSKDKKNILRINVGEVIANTAKVILLDIDKINLENTDKDHTVLSQKLENLHNEIKAVFSSSITEELKTWMKGL